MISRSQPSKAAVGALASVGGLIGAVATASCCVVPLVLFSLGATGAWIGNLTALSSYQPVFVAATLGFLFAGYWSAYRKPVQTCAKGSDCVEPRAGRFVRASLWAATILVGATIAFPYLAPAWLSV